MGLLLLQFPEQFLILLGGQVQLFVQVGPPLAGAENGLLPPPLGYLFMDMWVRPPGFVTVARAT